MNKLPSERNTTFQLKRALKAEDECRELRAKIIKMEASIAAARVQCAQDIIERLNRGVSVEPSYYWEPDGTIEWMKEGSGFSTNTGPAHGWKITHYYTAEALAAARVQMANEIMELPQIKGNLFAERAIRALIGGSKS